MKRRLSIFLIISLIIIILTLIFINVKNNIENVNIYNELESIENKNSEKNTSKIDIKLTDNFFNGMINEIFINYNDYNNKTISYEGFVYYNEEGKLGILRKYYCCGVDASLVGFECEIEGIKPDNNSWVKIEGIIKLKEYGDETIPYVKITDLELKKERGEETVYQ